MQSVETRRSWLIAIAVLLLLSVSFGAPLVVVVALRQIAEAMAQEGGTATRALPALASSLAYLGSGAGGVLMGWLAGKHGVRLTTAIGGTCMGLGLALASGGAPWHLLLGYGLLVGVLGNGALYPPLMTYVSLWFDRRRGTALALVSSGQYVAGALWPPLLERLVAMQGWQWTMAAFGMLVAAWVVPIALLLRAPPTQPVRTGAAAGPVDGAPVLRMPSNLALALLSAASFICCIPMAMPAAHLVAFCGDIGIGAATGAAMLSVLLACAFIARQAWGALSDRIGGLNTVIAGNVCQAVAMGLFLVTQDEAGLFLVSAIYGLGFGGIVPAYVLAVRELFPVQGASWRVPALLFSSLSGMAAGAWLAGALYDRFGAYAVAWEAGIIANVAALALLLWLAARREGGLRHRPVAVAA